MRIALIFVFAILVVLAGSCKKAPEPPRNGPVAGVGQATPPMKAPAAGQPAAAPPPPAKTSVATAKMPEGWPKNLPPFPGSKLVAQSSTDSTKGKQFSIVLECTDTVDKVLSYYDEKFSAAGFKKGLEQKKDDGTTRFYDTAKLAAHITVFTENGITKVSMSLGPA